MEQRVVVVVLGPVGARVDGRSVDLGGPRQRRLLAALAIEATTVGADRLADRVWGDGGLPDDPRRTLRTYLARLRQALGDTESILTADGGWRLNPKLVIVDAEQLRDRVDHASSPALDAHGRLAAVDAALELYAGQPFGDLADEDWVRGEAERLTQLQATLIERRYQAMLDAGRHTEAVPELAAEVEANPLRDRLVGLQMLALHRSGRQAEALRAFQAHRSRLADELGLEPGADLVELEHRILAGDAALLLTDSPGRALRSYRLGEQLGEGAFAMVYRGTQPSLGREVAVKIIRSELANRPEFIRRFEAEAHLVARLEHPRIVPLYDYWREPDRAFLVFRYLRGGTLEAQLTRSGPLPLDDAIRMIDHVGGGLTAAHEAGVIHRDVKPANVFCDEAGNYYLGDFGIALEASELSDPTAALSAGSPAYAAPEQLRRETIGPAADVHGLGISLYEALTARLPYPEATSQADLLQRQLSQPIPSIRAQQSHLPSAVDEVLARATAKDPSGRYQTVSEFVDALSALSSTANGKAAAPVTRPGAATTRSAGGERNPYKGLRAFTEADSDDFKGRERLVSSLVDILGRPDSSGRIAAVVGPSGIGKSSVVRAGLLPAIRQGAVAGSDQWFIATMTPGSDPFGELAAALLRVAAQTPGDLMTLLTDDHRGIARVVKAVVPEDSGAEVLLVIDQFEELFTVVDDDRLRRRFLDGLAHAVTDARCPLRVVLTMRADFWDRPLRYGGFARLIEQSTVQVTALAPDELERAIVEPAVSAGGDFEPGLVSEIVADVADQPGGLPLLQYALTELWDQRISGLLTREAYRSLGGVAGALSRRAELLHEQCPDDERAAIRRVFGRLVTPGDGTEDTRRRALRTEVATDPTTELVITRYGEARLLSFDIDPASREPTVEVAHEALIRQWPRLRAWLDEDREALRVLRHLAASAGSWAAGGYEDGDLYRGGRLEAAAQLEESGEHLLTDDERAFLDASTELRRAERAAARQRLEHQVRANRRLRRLLAGLGVLLALALVAGGLAVQQRSRANQAASASDVLRLATQATAAIDEDPDLALLLAIEAYDRAEALDEVPGEVRVALQVATQSSRLIHRFESGGRTVGVAPDGTRIAVVSPESPNVVEIRRIADGEELARIDMGWVIGGIGWTDHLSVVPDLNAENQPPDSAITLLDPERFEPVGRLSAGPCCRGRLAESQDGRYFAANLPDRTVAVWDLTDPDRAPRILDVGQIAGYIGDGRLVTISPEAFTLTDMETGETETWEPKGMPEVNFADPSPTNQNLLLSTEDDLLLWEFGADEPTERIDHRLLFTPIGAFLGDGERYVLVGQDDEVIIRSTADDTNIGLRGHPGFVTGLGLSEDETTLGVATVTGEVFVWDLTPAGPQELGNVPFRGFVDDIRIGRQQERIAIADSAGIRFLDQQTGAVEAELSNDRGGIEGGWPAGADQLVAAATTDEGEIIVVDLASSETLFEVQVCDDSVDAVDDGARWLYLAIVVRPDCDGEPDGGRVIDVETGEELVALPDGAGLADFGPGGTMAEGLLVHQQWTNEDAPDAVQEIVVRDVRADRIVASIEVTEVNAWWPFFSADGRYISMGSQRGGGLVFDVEQILAGVDMSEAVVINPKIEGGPTTFTKAGAGYLVTGHSGEALRYWNLDDGSQEMLLPTASRGSTLHAFSPDQRYHYYVSDGRVQRFPLDNAELYALARERVQRSFTPEECDRFDLGADCVRDATWSSGTTAFDT